MLEGRLRRVVAGGRRGDEGAVAGPAVEDEPVLEQADFQQCAQRPHRQAFRLEVFGVDRERLVVVPSPGDVGLQIDVAAEQAEAEASRLALVGDDVVDGDVERDGHAGEAGDGHFAFPHQGPKGTSRRVGMLPRPHRALRRGLRIDREALGQIDLDGPQVANRRFSRRPVFDDDLGEAHRGMAPSLFEPKLRGVNRAGDRGVEGARSSLPAVVGLRRLVLRRDDVGSQRGRRHSHHRQRRNHCGKPRNPRSCAHSVSPSQGASVGQITRF